MVEIGESRFAPPFGGATDGDMITAASALLVESGQTGPKTGDGVTNELTLIGAKNGGNCTNLLNPDCARKCCSDWVVI